MGVTEDGSYMPNAFGLYDMHENAGERAADWYGKHFYKQSPESDPKGPASGKYRITSGGGAATPSYGCTSKPPAAKPARRTRRVAMKKYV